MTGMQRGFVEGLRIKRAQEQGKEAAMRAQQVFLRRAELVRNNASPRFVAVPCDDGLFKPVVMRGDTVVRQLYPRKTEYAALTTGPEILTDAIRDCGPPPYTETPPLYGRIESRRAERKALDEAADSKTWGANWLEAYRRNNAGDFGEHLR